MKIVYGDKFDMNIPIELRDIDKNNILYVYKARDEEECLKGSLM